MLPKAKGNRFFNLVLALHVLLHCLFGYLSLLNCFFIVEAIVVVFTVVVFYLVKGLGSSWPDIQGHMLLSLL